ncbi:MAG: hypothetical protein DPW09_29510 [Anaerolineae bacterium]|nr:hypothetical protein [Anaerolineales bacterium]MCQ3977587.1 hypothetical protein [Anaerolineae bacterium]
MTKGGKIAIILLFLLVLSSLALNFWLYWQLNMAQQKVAGLVRQVRAGLPEAIDELESFEQATLTYEINIQQEFPVQTEIPFNETFEVPIQLTVPISQTIHTSVMIDPLGTGLQIPVEVNVPVNVEVPIDTSVPIAIERSIPISTTIPLDLNVPLAIKVAETDLAQYVAQLRTGLASLDEILAGLEP